jgi:hypothetical protein
MNGAQTQYPEALLLTTTILSSSFLAMPSDPESRK